MSSLRLAACAVLVLCACQPPVATEDTGASDTSTGDTSTGGHSASDTGSPSQASEPTEPTTGPVTTTTTTLDPGTTTLDPGTTTGDPDTTTTGDPGTTTGTTGPEIDPPPPGCDEAQIHNGDLVITDATDLSSLQCIVTVFGALQVEGTQSLESFAPLANLTYVRDRVSIRNNAALVDLAGLAGLERVVGSKDYAMVSVSQNPSLIDITGLKSLRQLDTLDISACDALTDLTGLQGPIAGSNEPSWRLNISENASLTSLAPLAAIEGFTGHLTIAALPQLTDLGDLAGFVGPELLYLSIFANPQLVDLTGLDTLVAVNDLHITNNAALVDLSGLDNLQTVSSNLYLRDNPSLQTLDGLQALTSTRRLSLDGNPALTSLAALGALSQVEWGLELGLCGVLGNDALLDLHGLEGLTQLGGLRINQNDLLKDITAIPHGIGLQFIEAFDNPQLPHAMLMQYLAETDLDPALALCNNADAPAMCECEFIEMP